MKHRWIVAAYVYSAMHIISWRIFLSGNGNKPWEHPFSIFFSLFFLPLNILAGGMCHAVWGSFDIFKARYVFGPILDFAIASLLSVTVVVATGVAVLRRQTRRRSIVAGVAPE